MSKLPPNACRLRVRYAKDGRLAYLGHLEVMNTICRDVRRAGLPFIVSNGFAHRMRIQFSQALPVGAASRAEYFDLLLEEPIDAARALADLAAATPRALAPDAAAILPRRVQALEAWADRSLWEVEVAGATVPAFEEGLRRVREAGFIDFMRGDKPRRVDVGLTLVSATAEPTKTGIRLSLETRTAESGSLRPAVLVEAACGLRPLRVMREGQWHEEEDGTLTAPL